MMDELINRVTQSSGLDADVAQKAVGQILAFLKKEGPEGPVSDVFAKIPGADDAAAAAASGGGGSGDGMMGALGGMMGGGGLMGLASKLTGMGLGMGEMQSVGKEVFSYAREKAGEDKVSEIAAAVPGLSQFI